MKRFLLIIVTVLFSSIVFSQARYWVGGPGGLWSNTANWSTISGGAPGASSPVTANDVIFDNSFSGNVEMDVLSTTTFTINSLLITASSTVTLQRTQAGGGTRVFQLASISSATKGLQIDNGSTLTIDAVNAGGTLNYEFAFTAGAGVTGEISGNLYFKGTGAGTGGAELDLQDDATHYAALVVKNSGVIKYFANSGNTGPGAGSYLTMESGSVYEVNKNGGSFPPGTWDPNSLAKVTGTTNSGPTFNGVSYGNLQWNSPGQTSAAVIGKDISFNNVDLINTGATSLLREKGGTGATAFTLTINGNLNVAIGTILETSGSSTTSGAAGIIKVKGNIINNGIIRELSTVAGNQFELNGTSNQNISGSGLWTGDDITFIMNNSAGATLLSPVTLSNKLTLTSGKIKTTSTNVLSMSDNAPIPTGGSPTSFVEGPMKKGGHDDTFTFPIGVGSIYAPATYFSFSGLTASDTIRAEYVRSNPQTTYGALYDPTNNPDHIDHISFVEYWKLQKMTGATISHNITLSVTEYSFCKNLSTTFITSYHSVGTLWQSCGTNFRNLTGTGGSQEFGTITTIGQLLVDSIFTLGTSDPFASNPLPITLISFDASKLSNTKSSINWELAACCSAAAKFEIQRADANKAFVTIATIGGSETNKLYDYIDNGLKNGINYYRLKMIDVDGKITYSRTVAVMNGVNALLITSLIPTVVTNIATLTIASSDQKKLDIVIVDMQGRVVFKRNFTIAQGNTNIGLQLGTLPAGVYQLTGISAEGKTNTIRFIKQ